MPYLLISTQIRMVSTRRGRLRQPLCGTSLMIPATRPPHPRGADTKQSQATGWAGNSAGTPTTRFASAAARARTKAKTKLSRKHSGRTCSSFKEGLILMH